MGRTPTGSGARFVSGWKSLFLMYSPARTACDHDHAIPHDQAGGPAPATSRPCAASPPVEDPRPVAPTAWTRRLPLDLTAPATSSSATIRARRRHPRRADRPPATPARREPPAGTDPPPVAQARTTRARPQDVRCLVGSVRPRTPRLRIGATPGRLRTGHRRPRPPHVMATTARHPPPGHNSPRTPKGAGSACRAACAVPRGGRALARRAVCSPASVRRGPDQRRTVEQVSHGPGQGGQAAVEPG